MKLRKDNLGKVAITVEQGYWDINKDYDKLTVVEKEGTFGTFISRKPVPIGTSLTDRNYWIPFSSLKEEILIDYNAFINKYDGIIKGHDTNLKNLNIKVKDLSDALEYYYTYLHDTVNDAISNLIADAPEAFDTLKEIADWIATHQTDAISMFNSIEENRKNIEKLLEFKDIIESKLNVIKITYKDLVYKRNAGNLIPGMYYRITDYETIIKETNNTKSANHPFDIIVFALDTSNLSEEAKVVKSIRDTDNYFNEKDLNSWKIWYSLDNDDLRFDWANENGKGVIYRMIDTYNNDIPYDFKNIMFRRHSTSVIAHVNHTDSINYFVPKNNDNINYNNFKECILTGHIVPNTKNDTETYDVDDFCYTFSSIKDDKIIDLSNIKDLIDYIGTYALGIYNNYIDALYTYTYIDNDNIYRTQYLNNIVFISNYTKTVNNDIYCVNYDYYLNIYNNTILNTYNCTFPTKCFNNTITNCINYYTLNELVNNKLYNCKEILSINISNSEISNIAYSIINYLKTSKITSDSITKDIDSEINIFNIENTSIVNSKFTTIIDENILANIYFEKYEISNSVIYNNYIDIFIESDTEYQSDKDHLCDNTYITESYIKHLDK